VSTDVITGVRRGTLGTSALRPDAPAKVQGRFAFSSDLWAENALWGATLRSPHPRATVVSIDVSAAWKIPGVETVLTADDVPGLNGYGLIVADQPVFASVGSDVLYAGQPIAAVAADHPDTARRALDAIRVEYRVLTPLTDPHACLDDATEAIHPDGNVFRHQRVICGDPDVTGVYQVEGEYEMGMQDQAFLGLEAAMALPDPDGRGVESVSYTHLRAHET